MKNLYMYRFSLWIVVNHLTLKVHSTAKVIIISAKLYSISPDKKCPMYCSRHLSIYVRKEMGKNEVEGIGKAKLGKAGSPSVGEARIQSYTLTNSRL